MASLSLSEKLEQVVGNENRGELTELVLDHSKATKIEGLSDDFQKLEHLSLVGVGLESIAGLPNLPALKKIDLSENNISNGLDALLNCPNLEHIVLKNNKIADAEVLKPLAKLEALQSLDLEGCEISQSEGYRKVVSGILTQLTSIDSLDDDVVNGDAEDEEDDSDEEDSEDEEEELGLEVLQRSEELEDDDEEDYAPAEDEDGDLDDYDDIDDDEVDEDDTGANLSGADVTGPRRPASKRQLVSNDDEEPPLKTKPAGDAADNHVGNGTSLDQ